VNTSHWLETLDAGVLLICSKLHQIGEHFYYRSPPAAVTFWQTRCWDRAVAERHPRLGLAYREQTSQISKWIKRLNVKDGKCLDLASGTGTFARVLSMSTDGSRIEALDVSSNALKSLAANYSDITTVETDFWVFIPSSAYDLIVCVDAIHHLGYVEDVIGKITELLDKNGILVANLWTADNFDEFQVMRYGRLGHFYRMVRFAVMGIVHAYLKKKSVSYRTHFVLAKQIRPLLQRHFHDIKYLEHQRYFSTFVCQGPK